MTTREKRLIELKEFLPVEALRVFTEGKDDEEWKEERVTIEGSDAWFEWCDGCSSYHQYWYVPEYVVRRGEITRVVHDVDTDGNWEYNDEFNELDDDDVARYERTFGYDAWREQYDEYVAHVAETGDDPCGEFMIATSNREKQVWTVVVAERAEPGLALCFARLKSPEPAALDHGNRLPDAWPKELRDYMCVEQGTDGWFTPDVRDFAHLDELLPGARRTTIAVGHCEFDVPIEVVTPRGEELVRAELIERASAHLAERAEEKAKG